MVYDKVLRTFYPLMIHGDVETLRRAFDGGPVVDSPTAGMVGDADAFKVFAAKQGRWLRDHEVTIVRQGLLGSSTRLVEEQILYLHSRKSSDDLPIALVADIGDGGIAALRIYHSCWRLTGGHAIREPILPPVDNLEMPQAVRSYFGAMAAGDVEAVMALFEGNGYLREPSGAAFRHQGEEGLRAFFESALADGGPVFHPCSVTVDEGTCAVEFVCDAWGRQTQPPQAGLAVFEFSPSERIVALRAYDDIAPSRGDRARV